MSDDKTECADPKVGDNPSPEKVAQANQKKDRDQRFQKGTEVRK